MSVAWCLVNTVRHSGRHQWTVLLGARTICGPYVATDAFTRCRSSCGNSCLCASCIVHDLTREASPASALASPPAHALLKPWALMLLPCATQAWLQPRRSAEQEGFSKPRLRGWKSERGKLSSTRSCQLGFFQFELEVLGLRSVVWCTC